jgi:hypothetical protein
VISAYLGEADAVAAGADAVLQKPFSFGKAAEALRRLLAGRG